MTGRTNMETIHFYLEEQDYHFAQSLKSIAGYDFRSPQLNWIWSTYFRLKKKGVVNICLTYTLPDKGIVVVASNQYKLLQKLSKDVFVISTVADSPPRFYTHINITQNPWQPSDYLNLFQFPVWKHIPHWPQPNLIPRNEARGNCFKNIAFFGNKDQIDPYLLSRDFEGDMKKMGLKFQIIDKEFNDYSSVDCVLAIRSFSNNPFLNKPYSKLVNAWFAKVPVIAGSESAFQSVKKSSFDFIAVKNVKELTEALQLLKENVVLREKMIGNGIERSKEFEEDLILHQWENFLFNEVPHYYQQWKDKGRLSRAIFYSDLFISRSFRSAKKRIFKTN